MLISWRVYLPKWPADAPLAVFLEFFFRLLGWLQGGVVGADSVLARRPGILGEQKSTRVFSKITGFAAWRKRKGPNGGLLGWTHGSDRNKR